MTESLAGALPVLRDGEPSASSSGNKLHDDDMGYIAPYERHTDMNLPYYTTTEERLGHRIQAHAILIGDDDISSCPAQWLGEQGSYENAKMSREAEEEWNRNCDKLERESEATYYRKREQDLTDGYYD